MIVVGFPLAVELDGGKRSQKAPLYDPRCRWLQPCPVGLQMIGLVFSCESKSMFDSFTFDYTAADKFDKTLQKHRSGVLSNHYTLCCGN
jgi:hypothetical protein